MRKVTLYTLKQEEVLTSNDHIAICSGYQRPTHILGSDEFILDAPLEVQALPIELYREYDTYEGDQEYLVAFDPKIRKLLHINEDQLKVENKQLKVKVSDLEVESLKLSVDNMELIAQNKELTKGNEHLDEMYQDYYIKYFRFVNLSFWKRVVFLFTGKVKEKQK